MSYAMQPNNASQLGMSTAFNATGHGALPATNEAQYVSFKQKYDLGKHLLFLWTKISTFHNLTHPSSL